MISDVGLPPRPTAVPTPDRRNSSAGVPPGAFSLRRQQIRSREIDRCQSRPRGKRKLTRAAYDWEAMNRPGLGSSVSWLQDGTPAGFVAGDCGEIGAEQGGAGRRHLPWPAFRSWKFRACQVLRFSVDLAVLPAKGKRPIRRNLHTMRYPPASPPSSSGPRPIPRVTFVCSRD
jgi:hypothetical protein